MQRVTEFQIDCPGYVASRDSKWLGLSRRQDAYNLWAGKCYACGDSLPASKFHIDHIVDGPHRKCHHSACNYSFNYACICPNCNSVKGNTVGNWTHFLRHAALDRGMGGDELIAQVTAKLYAPHKDMAYFIGKDAHMAAFTLTRHDSGIVTPNGVTGGQK